MTSHPEAPPQFPAPSENLLRDLMEEMVRRWRVLIGLPVGAAAVGVVLSFVVPPQYEGVAIFSPAEDVSSLLPSSLQSIASQFGVSVPSKGYTVYYFAQVAQSREVLHLVVLDTIRADGQTLTVLALLGGGGAAPAERLENGIRRLKDRLIVRTDDQADLVTVRARGPTPESAAALAAAVLKALNEVTTASIRSGGSAERRFAQAQADSAREALRGAEDRLRDFLLANRIIASSPTLQFEEARLRRQIQIRQDLYIALINQAEAAKLREVRNTPSIALIQPPQASTLKVWPRASVWALFALIGAFTAVAGWLYVVRPMLPEAALALASWRSSPRPK